MGLYRIHIHFQEIYKYDIEAGVIAVDCRIVNSILMLVRIKFLKQIKSLLFERSSYVFGYSLLRNFNVFRVYESNFESH